MHRILPILFKQVLAIGCFCMLTFFSFAQVVTQCPQNIGFELGNFTNWQCYRGSISQTGGRSGGPLPPTIIVSSTAATPGFHTIITGGADPYGHFSLSAPNGSSTIVQLGNSNDGRSAERITYTINVPANVESYSVIFNYAVVFFNPNDEHDDSEQPKFTANVFDVTTNSDIDCLSFRFVSSGDLPGFEASDIPAPPTSNNANPGNGTVLYKPWSPVLLNLSEYRGHTIRLEFTVNDCSRGGHFGYAYIDFDENCSIPIGGNITCPDVPFINLKALPGFAAYRWYDVATQQTLGTGETLSLKSPLPPPGTKIAVELRPYTGLGCTQILTTTIGEMNMKIGTPTPTCLPVDLTATYLTEGNSSDITYSYWLDIGATRKIPDPKRITVSDKYYVKGTSSSGCTAIVEVTVTILKLNEIVVTPPAPVTYPAPVDITRTFTPEQGIVYTYWQNPAATLPVKNPTNIRLGGTFYIKGTNSEGCFTISPVTVEIFINGIIIPNTFTPNGDGVNDVFTVLVNSGIKIKLFRIYNRWGETVFITPEISNYWTGLKDQTKVPGGVYYWVLEAEENGKEYKRSGSVTVIR